MKSDNSQLSQSRQPWYIHRNFALLWIGQAVSNLGDFTFNTSIILLIGTALAHGQSWGPLAVSGVLISAAIPTFLLGPIAGVLADRWNKQRILLLMDFTRAVLICLLTLLSGSIPFIPFSLQQMPTSWQLTTIYSTVFLTSICAQFFAPARFALASDIIDEPQRAQASGLGQVTANLALLVGPSLGALLFFRFGVQWAFLLNALSFIVSFFTIRLMHISQVRSNNSSSPQQLHQVLAEFIDGLRVFGKNHELQIVFLSMVLVLFGGGATESLNLFFVIQNLHANAGFYGLLSTISSAGLLLGAILASYVTQRIGITKAFWIGILVTGLLEMIYSRLSSSLFALILVFFQGFPNSALNIAMGPLVMKMTPRTHTGRVLALFIPAMTLANMISAFLAGQIASTVLATFHMTILGISFGPFDTIILFAGLITTIGGIFAMAKLRSV